MSGIQNIETLFKQQKAYIGYLMAGHPDLNRTVENALALIEGGVNLLELGMPFSDPVADGLVIQEAAEEALLKGMKLQATLQITEQIRRFTQTPIILFSYYNPILAHLNGSFLNEARASGIDGLLAVDCPFDESSVLQQATQAVDLALINVIAPTTSLTRLKKINQSATGFLYYACRSGTTGVKSSLPNDFKAKMQLIKANTHLPVVAGFGISDYKMVQEVLKEADGAVVGSYFVKAVLDGACKNELKQMTKQVFFGGGEA